ncbi:hypothetical protein Pcinc_031301 [Petrolisthes cinctipes]|uniref:Innexin n=1 Tax=Petrolisthes cinctipes TaxID=88211 RepID=A0AAE1EWE0_PETCI|nr:hypothetical protein Pcinc_031301 [Petrolisthes cinctipes]
MFSLFDDVKKQISTSGATKAKVGSVILFTCKLCMMITTLACILVTAKTYIVSTSRSRPHHQPRPHPDHQTGDGDSTTTTPEDDLRRHAYYQWVPMVLFLQAAVFYFPIWIWNLIDKGYFQAVLCGLDKIHIGDYSKELTAQPNSSPIPDTSSVLRHRLLLCEMTAFAISVAKCTWYKYGPSGTIQQHDSLCVLPLNIVNEKTYIFLWIVYIFAAIVCGIFFSFVSYSSSTHREKQPPSPPSQETRDETRFDDSFTQV